MPEIPTSNTIRDSIDTGATSRLSSWFDNPEEAYDLEAVREMHGKAI